MQAPPLQRLTALKTAAVHVFSTAVRDVPIGDVPLAQAGEVASFATENGEWNT